MREGSAIFTLAFYRQLSHSIPIPTLHIVRGGRSKGQRWCLGTQTASHPHLQWVPVQVHKVGRKNRVTTHFQISLPWEFLP